MTGFEAYSVSAEFQGKHGLQPPLDKMKAVVAEWLWNLRVDTGEFGMQVTRNSPAGSFYGVRSLKFVENQPHILELRTRVSGDDYQWKSRLICPTRNLAASIISRDRPYAARYIGNLLELGSENASFEEMREEFFSLDSEVSCIYQKLNKPKVMRRFCCSLAEQMDSQQNIPEGLIKNYISVETGETNDYILSHVICRLIIEGVLEVPSEQNSGMFLPTLIFQEEINKQQIIIKNEKQEQFERDLEIKMRSIKITAREFLEVKRKFQELSFKLKQQGQDVLQLKRQFI